MRVEAWSRRPFARAFDLISREYGWTDDTILHLTVGRFVQIRSVCFERLAEERRERLQAKEIELQTLASFMARSEKGLAAARQIRLLDPPADEQARYTRNGKRIGMIPAERVSSLLGGAR